MSWSQTPPQQRYSAVPGFERPESMASVTNTPQPENVEINNFSDPFNNPPPPHRAELYNDPFPGGSPDPSHAALLNDDSSMYSGGTGRPSRNQYANMDSPRAAGGYGSQYPVGHGTQGATADELWAMQGGNDSQRHFSDEKAYGGDGTGAKRGGSKKWLWIGIIALLLCVGVGVGVGVGVSQSNKSNSSSSSNGKSNSDDFSNTIATGDPSKFSKDDNLHQVFWGLAYSPKDSIWPDCWANISTVTKDIQLLSQLTTRLRLYGAMCNVTALTLQAIKDTKVDMKIYPAIYIDSNDTAYDVQVEALKDAFTTYGVDNVEGVAVGNEYLLIEMTADEADIVPEGSSYTSAVSSLSKYITKFRSSLDSWNLGKTIPVGTGDAGALMSVNLAQYIDYFMANVHPWFANTTVQDGPTWTWDFFEEWDVKPAQKASNKPETYIAETGWPTGSSPPTSESGDKRSPVDATLANLQYFLDNYVCQANDNGTKYFYFEPFDEEWKDKRYGGVEGHWGLFDKNRNLKDIKIPTCT